MPKPSRRLFNQPQPLIFNDLCGKGITLSNNNRVATRSSGFGDALVFSSRTVRCFERIFLRHRHKEVDWIGSLRVGFCVNDPKRFTRDTLPSLAFKHLTDKDGYYLRACPDELLQSCPIIYFYYSYDGQIFIGGYGQLAPAQAVLTINDHNGPYFFFAEIYGKTDQIEIIDETTLPDQSFVFKSNINHIGSTETSVNSKIAKDNRLLQLQYFNYLYPSNTEHKLTFIPSQHHNISTIYQNRIACVNNLEVRASYAFVNSSMKPDDVLICRVMVCDATTSAVLSFGLTTCNPSSLKSKTLPEDSIDLMKQNSSFQWIIEPDISGNISMFDELAFWFDSAGRIYLSINNNTPKQLQYSIPSADVRQSTFYPFFDLYGQITSLCLFNLSSQNKLNWNIRANARTLCSICSERLSDTQLLPCLCIMCSECAAIVKRPNTISECPFDRKHISQVRPLP